MSQSSSKKSRRAGNENSVTPMYQFREVKPLNQVQSEYLHSIRTNEITFGIGSAGTGKTFISAGYAAKELYDRHIDKIILTRPNVETGRGLGFLPGELDEKYAPYLEPFESIFTQLLGKGFYDYALKSKQIDPKPLGFMRGTSFDNTIILVDEVQNMTKTEFKMLLSRIGKNCKMILSGDPEQSDITNSGLPDAINRLQRVPSIGITRFEDDDIVRSKICKNIILAYRD